jgi:hypothetical protein
MLELIVPRIKKSSAEIVVIQIIPVFILSLNVPHTIEAGRCAGRNPPSVLNFKHSFTKFNQVNIF